MKIGFSQTAAHCVSGSTGTDLVNRLPTAIHKHSGLNYSCTQTDDGCFLKPSFRNMPYRNSFVPEIDIRISQKSGQTSLHMKGQPVKFVRIFMRVWFAALLIIEAILLAAGATSGMDSLFSLFIPVVIGILGYFLCKIATNATFHTVVKVIQKEFP